MRAAAYPVSSLDQAARCLAHLGTGRGPMSTGWAALTWKLTGG